MKTEFTNIKIIWESITFLDILLLSTIYCGALKMQVRERNSEKNVVKSKKKILPKSIRFLFGFSFFFGLDMGCFKSHSIICKLLVKFICITIAVTSAFIITIENLDDFDSILWFSICSIEYIIYVLIVLSSSNSFRIYLHKFLDFDREFRTNLIQSVKYNFVLSWIMFSLSKLILGILYCKWDGAQCISVLAVATSHFQILATDIVYIFKINIIYMVLSRLKFLQSHMKNGKNHTMFYSKINKSIFFYHVKYKEIVDSILQIKPLFDTMVIFFVTLFYFEIFI